MNVVLALIDTGVGAETALEEIDRLTLCCPTYSDEGGCQGYSAADRDQPAYWYSR
jgi:hypothetical protein